LIGEKPGPTVRVRMGEGVRRLAVRGVPAAVPRPGLGRDPEIEVRR
jgi:hypothetical protein